MILCEKAKNVNRAAVINPIAWAPLRQVERSFIGNRGCVPTERIRSQLVMESKEKEGEVKEVDPVLRSSRGTN